MNSITEFFIKEHIFKGEAEIRQASLLVNGSLLTSLFSTTYLLLSLIVEFEMGIYMMVFNVAAFVILPFAIKSGLKLLYASQLFIFSGTFAVAVLIIFSGGFRSAIYPWMMASPILALLLINKKSSYFWAALSLLTMAYFAFLEFKGVRLEAKYNQAYEILFTTVCALGLLLILYVINIVFESNRSNAMDKLKHQNEELESARKSLSLTNQEIVGKNQQLEQQKEEINSQKDNLETINAEKDYIIEVLSHDLKSPLNQIMGLTSLMEMEPLNATQKEYIDLINKSNKQIKNLINKILSMGQLEHGGNTKLELQKVDVAKVIKVVMANWNKQALKKQIQFNEELVDSLFIYVDQQYFIQIIDNLISNAIKFSPKECEITISATTEDGQVIVAIRDQGPGIKEEEKHLLFEKYQKLSAQPTGGEDSSGLGLSLVKKYVETMGGTIGVNNNEDKGSTFFVSFPLYQSSFAKN